MISRARTMLDPPAKGPVARFAWRHPRASELGSAGALAAALGYTMLCAWLGIIVAIFGIGAGWEPRVIRSGSMAPALAPGSIVLIDRDPAPGLLSPGQIATFASDTDSDQTLTHRIVGINDDGSFQTKGDANARPDSSPVTPTDLHGVTRLVVPHLGLPVAWLLNEMWPQLVAWSLLSILCLTLVVTALLGARDRPHPHVPRRSPLRRWTHPLGPRHAGAARSVAAAVVCVGLLVVAAGSTGSAFHSSTDNGPSTLVAADDFGGGTYSELVYASAPLIHWRLADAYDVGESISFGHDFEATSTWNAIGNGMVIPTADRAHDGVRSGTVGRASGPDDGGWIDIGTPAANRWTLSAWVYRPDVESGAGPLALSLEDDNSDGYSVSIDVDTNTLSLQRRDRGVEHTLAEAQSVPVPEQGWFLLTLRRSEGTLIATADPGGGSHDARATDDRYAALDRVTIRGGAGYYVDDVDFSGARATAPVISDSAGALDALPVGRPHLARPGLLSNDDNAAVGFDGHDDGIHIPDGAAFNLVPVAQRSVELWFNARRVEGRQVLFEQGGRFNGLAIYLDGATLNGRSWSSDGQWTRPLEVTTTVSADATYHVVLALNATRRTMTMYVNGVPADRSTKRDTRPLSAHEDDGAIGMVKGGTQFHDGAVNGGGYHAWATIDEVAVYDHVFTTQEAKRHYRRGSGAAPDTRQSAG